MSEWREGTIANRRFDETLDTLPDRYPGPGGGVAVLRDGAVLASRCWGWADAERRIAFTPRTMALVCSITKQFTCALMLDQFPDPTMLDADVRHFLPALPDPVPGALHLAHNQSGLRDYWALAMLCGAPVEGVFGPDDARRLIGRARSLHFVPGTRYSYANQNFRLLSDIIERRADEDFAGLLRRRVLDPAGMPHAVLSPDTSRVPGGTVGYEGSVEHGFRPAVNRIHWTGDAGLAACLDDMIAWEAFIDVTRDQEGGLYRRLSAPQTFAGGAPAAYGFGLAHAALHGRAISGHGGGLRGWRSFRLYAPSERVSVVVLFNHMADARAAAADLFAALLDAPQPEAPAVAVSGLAGRYWEPETGLAVRVAPLPDHRLRLDFTSSPDTLTAVSEGEYAAGQVRLCRDADGARMERPSENLSSRLTRCAGTPPRDIEGVFHSAELDADLTCVSAGGVPHAAFSGAHGQGEMHALLPFDQDAWLLPCPRALDHAPPGDWTLRFRRDDSGRVAGVQVGCWLARRVDYARV